MNTCTDRTGKAHIASKAWRFVNNLLDTMIFTLVLFPTWYFTHRLVARLSVFDADTALWLTNSVGNWSLTIGSLFFYYFVFEAIWQRTPAKFITGTKVVDLYGTKPTVGTIALRTLVRLIPFEPFSFLGKGAYGWHDTLSQTFVIRSKTLEVGTQSSPLTASEHSGITGGVTGEETMHQRILRGEAHAKWFAIAFLMVLLIAIVVLSSSSTLVRTEAKTGELNVVQSNPRPSEETFRGAACLLKGQYDLAISEFTKSIKMNPNDQRGYYFRGLAYFQRQQSTLAISDFTKAITMTPSDGKAYHARGRAYLQQKQYTLAIADFTKAIEMNPSAAQSYRYRGCAYAMREQFALAALDLTTVIELEPDNAEMYFKRGLLYHLEGKRYEALEDMRRAQNLGYSVPPEILEDLK